MSTLFPASDITFRLSGVYTSIFEPVLLLREYGICTLASPPVRVGVATPVHRQRK